MSDEASHGWTAVARDPQVLFKGKGFVHPPQPLLVKDIPFPDDALVQQVQAYAKEKMALPTYNHSMRVYCFAVAILEQQFPEHAATLARPTLALASLLHDVGTTDYNLRATRMSFEFYGGVLALALIRNKLQPIAPPIQAESVAEAIMRHQDLGETGTITLLGQLLQLATVYDNTGGHPELVHADTKADVNRAYPRHGWSICFGDTIDAETSLKPWAHTTKLGRAFPEGVRNNKLMAEFE